jgi:hypothetical protein
MGGADIGGSERNCDACFASSMLACAPRLAALPGYAGVDLGTLNHGMFEAARSGYDATLEDHRLVSRTYAKFDKQSYHTLRGGLLEIPEVLIEPLAALGQIGIVNISGNP